MNLKIICPKCSTTNNVPKDRILNKPKCGRCSNAIIVGNAIEANEKMLKKTIKISSLTVIVDFWAPWCGPCTTMAPIFNQAAAQLKGTFILLKINTELIQRVANQHAIRSIPTLIAFKNGTEINRISGAMPLNQLVQWIRAN